MNLEIISKLKPSDLESLTPQQESALNSLLREHESYDLGKGNKPMWLDNTAVRKIVWLYSNRKTSKASRELFQKVTH